MDLSQWLMVLFVVIMAVVFMVSRWRAITSVMEVEQTEPKPKPTYNPKMLGFVAGASRGKTSFMIERAVRYHNDGYLVVFINSEERLDTLYSRIRSLSNTEDDLDIMIKSINIWGMETSSSAAELERYMNQLMDANEIESDKKRVYMFDINAGKSMIDWLNEHKHMFNAEMVAVSVQLNRESIESGNPDIRVIDLPDDSGQIKSRYNEAEPQIEQPSDPVRHETQSDPTIRETHYHEPVSHVTTEPYVSRSDPEPSYSYDSGSSSSYDSDRSGD
jgi:hypothetical protein